MAIHDFISENRLLTVNKELEAYLILNKTEKIFKFAPAIDSYIFIHDSEVDTIVFKEAQYQILKHETQYGELYDSEFKGTDHTDITYNQYIQGRILYFILCIIYRHESGTGKNYLKLRQK